VVVGPGNNNAFGPFVIDHWTLSGVVTLSGRTGEFTHFHAGPIMVACPALPDCPGMGRTASRRIADHEDDWSGRLRGEPLWEPADRVPQRHQHFLGERVHAGVPPHIDPDRLPRRQEKSGPARLDLFVLDLATGKTAQVLSKKNANLESIKSSTWSPDGAYLAFHSSGLSIDGRMGPSYFCPTFAQVRRPEAISTNLTTPVTCGYA